MSRRTQQVSSLLERAIQDVITRGLHDPRISGLITVTGVDIPSDMSKATVNFTVIPEERESLTRHGLQDASGYIRRQVGEMVRMRRVPDLTFRIDSNAKEQAAVLGAIARARAEFVETEDDQTGDADSIESADATGRATERSVNGETGNKPGAEAGDRAGNEPGDQA
jgi:ribosome-binding factor A